MEPTSFQLEHWSGAGVLPKDEEARTRKVQFLVALAKLYSEHLGIPHQVLTRASKWWDSEAVRYPPQFEAERFAVHILRHA